MAIDISVVVPIYNALEDTKLLLDSLVKNFNFENNEIWLINDCSNKNTTDFLRNFVVKNSSFILIENDENLGFVKTCNKGMKLANGEIIVLLNSDTIIPSGFCECIKKCFESDKSIGVASPISSNSYSYYIKQPLNTTIEQMNSLLRKNHNPTYPTILAAEGFCFCVRKDVIQEIGYFDEVFGKGYHEEVDFAYRAFSKGWFNVLIDDLYVYHKKNASFGEFNSNELIVKNDKIFHERWDDFVEMNMPDFIPEEIISKIQNDMFSKKRKIIDNCLNYVKKTAFAKTKYITKRPDVDCKTCAIFALLTNNNKVSQNVTKYIQALKKHCNYLIVITNKKLNKNNLSLLKQLVDVIFIDEKINTNFDAYKKGVAHLKSSKDYQLPEKIIFTDDSVFFVGEDLNKIFEDSTDKDFYCITQNNYGFIKDNERYHWGKYRHFSPYFFMVSQKIFNSKFFEKFITTTKPESRLTKFEKQEVVLNSILQNEGYKINSFYPPIEEIINIDGYYLKLPKTANENIYFVKKYYSFEYSLYDFIKNLKNEKTVFWGASNALKTVLNIFPQKNDSILGIIDKNNALSKNFSRDYKIYNPAELKNLNPQSILITIKNNGNRIYKDIKNYVDENHPNIKVLPNLLVQKEN
ncbi:glycosyltransferase [bacterium]|nr:glycosyltransferase [bacterium]